MTILPLSRSGLIRDLPPGPGSRCQSDGLPQVPPLKVVIELRAGLGTLDDAPPVSYSSAVSGSM